ncbi:hypothetical protein B9Z19DRAFT_1121213 [Tuber borchii]|uniref:Uncharacterized protein n=1 Tax=Tuber borchii TaxID=42251 RepID=A0A2T7A334_TUBBO|nr:hypothetical protein B9Z19DRAFT_1121213 [Tuber borchii]
MAPTTTSATATSTILPNIPTNNPTAPILRPTPIYNFASPPLPRSRRKLKITIPDSGYTVAVSKPDNTLDLRRTSLQNPRHILEFALTPQLGLGQRWVAMWCDSRWVWTRTGWAGEAIWRKTGDYQRGQVVWVLEISAVAAGVGGGAGEEESADHPVGVQITGKVGRDVWVECGAGAGVLAGVTEDGLVMLALLTAALVQLM